MRLRIRASLVLLTLWLSLTATVQGASPKPEVEAVGAISMTVSNLDRAISFYARVLTFETVSHQNGAAELKLGDESIELVQTTASHPRPIPRDSRSNDHWFQHIAIIVSDM